ncbi:VOC family protein [Bacillus cereus]
MVLQRVSLITIGAFNLPVLRKFYKSLGWEETEISSDTYAAFKTAGVILSIFPIEELAKDAGVSITQGVETFRGVAFAINVDNPEQVDATVEEVRKIGGKILREPSNAFGVEEHLILLILRIIYGKLHGIQILYLMKEEL